MSNKIGDLNVSLTADINGYKRAITEAEKLTRTFGNNLKGSLGDAAVAVKGFVGAWAGMQAVNGVLSKLNATGDLTDIAAGLNITTDALQKMEYAGIGAGVSVEQFQSLLQRVSDASAKFAEGNEDIVDTFKKLKISAVDLNAPDKTLMQIIEHLNNIPSAAERMRAAIEIGGKGGAQALLKLAATGRDELEATMDSLAEKGLLIGNNTIQGADKAGDAIATLAYEFQQKLKVAVSENAETIAKLGSAAFTVMAELVDWVAKAAKGFIWLGESIGTAAAKLSGFETGEDKLKRQQGRLPELARQEDSLYKKYSQDSSVQRGKPSLEAERIWAQLQDVRQTKAAVEKDIAALYDFYKEAPVAPKSDAKPTTNEPPKLTGPGKPKGKAGSATTKAFETQEEQIAKSVASLLERTDNARLEVLGKQAAELERQQAIWLAINTDTLGTEQQEARNAAIAQYNQALADVLKQQEAILYQEDEFSKATEEWTTWAEKQRDIARAIEETVDPTAKLKREIEEVKKLTEDGFLPTETAEKYIQTIQDKTKETTDYVRDLGMTFQSAFQDAIMEGKGFQDVMQGIVKDIAAMILKMAVINPMMKALFGDKGTGGTGGSEGIIGAVLKGIVKGFTASADGNVFMGHIQPFANGGVVNSPTLFPMNGGTGLMGEAGAEAIMPLKRINGKLGVQATVAGSGGNSVVNNIVVNVEGGKDAQQTGDIVAEKIVRAIAQQEIAAAKRIGGALNPLTVGGY